MRRKDHQKKLPELSEKEILTILAELEEFREVQLEGNEHDRRIVFDRRLNLQRLIDQMSYASLPFYAKYQLGLLVAQHHVDWSNFILATIAKSQEKDQARGVGALLAPRDHGKSAWFSYACALWFAHIRYPGETGAISGEGDIAFDLLKFIKGGNPNRTLPGIMNTDTLKHLKQPGGIGWRKDEIELTNRSIIKAKGAKSAWRGKHPKWLIADDLLSQECAFSPTERARCEENLVSVLIPMVKEGPVIIVGTPLNEQDVYAHIQKIDDYQFLRTPALYPDEETGEEKALWPERYTVKVLHTTRVHMGALRFAREYMCLPISNLSSMFPPSLFGVHAMDKSFSLKPPRAWFVKTCTSGRYISMDLAFSSEIGADFCVFFVVGLDNHGNRYLLDLVRRQGMRFHDMVNTFIALGVHYGVEMGIIESNQAQKLVAEEAIAESPFPIIQHQTGTEKHLLDRGIPSLRILLETSKYRFPQGDEISIAIVQILQLELQAMTIQDGKIVSTAKFKDCVMAMWFIELLLQRISFGGAYFDTQEGDEEAFQDYWNSDEDDFEDEVSSSVRDGFHPRNLPIPSADDIVRTRSSDPFTSGLWGWGKNE